MRRRLLSVAAVAVVVIGGLLAGTAQAHGPHYGHGCRPGGLYGGGYGGYYGAYYPPYNVYSNRYAVPYGAGYSGGWQPYQGFYRPGPRAQVGLYFGY